MLLKRIGKASPLVILNAFETAVPFLRMIILTRLLDRYHFGFVSTLAATYAALEGITDIAIYRFVSSSPRENFREALGAAHVLTMLRGFGVALLILLTSYPMSCNLAGCAEWPSFALLAIIPVIRGCENLEVRVAERDYRYMPLLKMSIASQTIGLGALALSAQFIKNQDAFIIYLAVQSLVALALTHRYASAPYPFKLRSPELKRGLAFGLPLMANGVGLAISGSGDRLVVGKFIGIEAVGLYSLLILSALLPMTILFRILGVVHFAGLLNAKDDLTRYFSRLRLYCSTMPVLAAFYAAGVIAFLPIAFHILFAGKYEITDLALIFLALTAFFRIIRTEPYTSSLLQRQATRTLAIVNQAPALGLAVAIVAAYLTHNFSYVLIGNLSGEIFGFCVFFTVNRKFFAPVIPTQLLTVVVTLGILLGQLVLTYLVFTPTDLVSRAGVFVVASLGLAVYSGLVILPLGRKAYG